MLSFLAKIIIPFALSSTFAINYHSFAEITISENWFSTTIAASYIANSAGINERLITYANNLNSSKKTLSEYAIYRVE